MPREARMATPGGFGDVRRPDLRGGCYAPARVEAARPFPPAARKDRAVPYSFSVMPERRRAVVRFRGPFELEQALSAPLELFAHADFEPGFGVVVEMRSLREGPDVADALAVARNLVRFRALFEGPVAVVVGEGPIHRLAEVTASLAGLGGFPVQIFHEESDAEAWIESRIGGKPGSGGRDGLEGGAPPSAAGS